MANILYCEDFDLLRMGMQQHLVRAGHTVFAFADGKPALDYLLQHTENTDRINILVLDNNMQIMMGQKLLIEIARNPLLEKYRLPVIGAGEFDWDFVYPQFYRLPKPFSYQDLLQEIQQSLACSTQICVK